MFAAAILLTACGKRDETAASNDSIESAEEALLKLPTEDIGSASALVGDCLWINVFMDNEQCPWDAESKAAVKEMVTDAGNYITKQGKTYGAEVRFEYKWSDSEGSYPIPHYANGATFAVDTFKNSGYGGYDGYVNALLEGTEYGNYFLMFHFNCHGRSFSVPCDTAVGEDSDYYSEFCVAFYSGKEDGDYFACPAAYAHEVLHCFGAVDINEERLDGELNALAEEHFPDDIMRAVPENIENGSIGVLSASLIGWENSVPEGLKELLKKLS